jgi:hypothetical protein
MEQYLSSTHTFPWYDSWWHTSYLRARDYLAAHHPEKLAGFNSAMAAFRTPADFRPFVLRDALDEADHQALLALATAPQQEDLEKHELFSFGRFVIHNHPVMTAMQLRLVERMSDWVGEPVEARYNFLSLYNNLGVCEPHMDAPDAKWTLDYCIAQSDPWPIHFSDVQQWPETWLASNENWQQEIKSDPRNAYTGFSMQEKEALVFSGSSQWHYRDRIARQRPQNFCYLAFFHFIPEGLGHLVNPANWAEIFGVPALAEFCLEGKNSYLPDTDH